jgi:uncharacterized membrane protein
MVIGWRNIRLPNRELLLSSNANVSGRTTGAAAMAQTKERPQVGFTSVIDWHP